MCRYNQNPVFYVSKIVEKNATYVLKYLGLTQWYGAQISTKLAWTENYDASGM